MTTTSPTPGPTRDDEILGARVALQGLMDNAAEDLAAVEKIRHRLGQRELLADSAYEIGAFNPGSDFFAALHEARATLRSAITSNPGRVPQAELNQDRVPAFLRALHLDSAAAVSAAEISRDHFIADVTVALGRILDRVPALDAEPAAGITAELCTWMRDRLTVPTLQG